MDEPWFKALAQEQSRQDTIDKRESYSLPYNSTTDIYGVYNAPELLSKRDVGRPSTDWRIINKVLKIYDESVEDVKEGKAIRTKSLRAIAREVNDKIDHCTVRNIIIEFRKKHIQVAVIDM